jgi:hypothetical protein
MILLILVFLTSFRLWRKEVRTFKDIANRILGLELASEEIEKEN